MSWPEVHESLASDSWGHDAELDAIRTEYELWCRVLAPLPKPDRFSAVGRRFGDAEGDVDAQMQLNDPVLHAIRESLQVQELS